MLNQEIKYAKLNTAGIQFTKLDTKSTTIVAYCIVASASNHNLSSQHSRLILFCDKDHNAIPIVYKSYKSGRITRYVLTAEIISFSDLFDDALGI